MRVSRNATDRPDDDTWIVSIHRAEHELAPIGSGVLIDDRRILTCAHVVCDAEIPKSRLWIAFPMQTAYMPGLLPARVTMVPAAGRQKIEDVAVLELDGAVSVGPARLRCPQPGELEGRKWWAFGFPGGDTIGAPASGSVQEAQGWNWVGLRTDTGNQRVAEGFSGAALWSPDYDAVVGIIGQADDAGDARALSLFQADRLLPELKLRTLADWNIAAVDEGALASWGWSLADDPEAGRHWRPRARGVARDSEGGYRFRGRRAALTRIVEGSAGG